MREFDVYNIIDTTWTVSAQGSNTAASYFALVNIDNAERFVGNYAFQLIVYRNASYAIPNPEDDCESITQPAPQILSNVTQNPFVENPFVENPFVENPFVENPFVENPFVENSTFALAPSDAPQEAYASMSSTSGDGTLKAPRRPDQVKVLLRAYQIVPDSEHGGFRYNPDPAQGGDSPAVTVISHGCDTHDPAATCYYSNAPDLVASGVDPTPVVVRAGDPFEFPVGGWTLHNQGTVAANAENRDLRHGVYLSADGTVHLGPGDQPLDGDLLLGFQPSQSATLAVGGQEAFDAASLRIPRDVPPGDYFLVLYVDDYREVSESDERNNQVAVAVTVTSPPPSWLFVGFDTPWSPLYEINAGSAVPLKWYYGDPDTGVKVPSFTSDLEITATGYTDCVADGVPVGDPIAVLGLPEDAGSSDLRYKDGDWQLNWDTSDQLTGCYLLAIYHPTTNQLDTENSQGEPLAIVLR